MIQGVPSGLPREQHPPANRRRGRWGDALGHQPRWGEAPRRQRRWGEAARRQRQCREPFGRSRRRPHRPRTELCHARPHLAAELPAGGRGRCPPARRGRCPPARRCLCRLAVGAHFRGLPHHQAVVRGLHRKGHFPIKRPGCARISTHRAPNARRKTRIQRYFRPGTDALARAIAVVYFRPGAEPLARAIAAAVRGPPGEPPDCI